MIVLIDRGVDSPYAPTHPVRRSHTRDRQGAGQMKGFWVAKIIAAAFLVGFVLRTEFDKAPLSLPFDLSGFVQQLVVICTGAGLAYLVARGMRRGDE